MEKFINKENTAFVLKVCICALLALGIIAVIHYMIPSLAWSSDDLIDISVDVLGDFKHKLVTIALAAFPVSLIVLLLGIFFLHDDRTLAFVIRACIVVCVATALILFIEAGTALETLKSLFKIGEAVGRTT